MPAPAAGPLRRALRAPPELSDRSFRLLGAVALALLFEEYDLAMLTSALKQIAEELGMQESRFGLYLALVRAGAVAAFVVVPFADRLGRRPVFIGATAAMGVLTFATAFTQTPVQFVVMQAMTRTFFLAGSAVAFVIITEEFPAAHRGWGLGMLAAIGATGHGVAALAYAQIDRLPYGWRALYAMGLVPVLLVPFFLSRIPETSRFQRRERDEAHASMGGVAAVLAPLRALAVTHPGRAAGIAAAGFLTSIAILPSFQFSSFYVQQKLGWSPGDYSLMLIAGGGVGIVGNVVGGRLGDVYGRRRVGFVLLGLFPACSLGYYQGEGAVVVASWVGLVFFSMGGRIILRALSTELFPTSHRGAASGMFNLLETLGGVTGLLVIYFYGTEDVHDIGTVTPLIAAAIYLGTFVILGFPETRQRELEEIS